MMHASGLPAGYRRKLWRMQRMQAQLGANPWAAMFDCGTWLPDSGQLPDERIAHLQPGKSAEVPVRGPQFVDAMEIA